MNRRRRFKDLIWRFLDVALSAVQAGLGQMGFNGQLLTPGAGARVTLTAIITSAQLAHDEIERYVGSH